MQYTDPRPKGWPSIVFVAVVLLTMSAGCRRDPGKALYELETEAPVYPDYRGVTVPVNISPLNFRVRGAKAIKAVYSVGGRDELTVIGSESLLDVPSRKWRSLLEKVNEGRIDVTVSIWDDRYPDGVRFKPFPIFVSPDTIDRYVSYRLIEPGYEGWKRMGIYQRDVTDFRETAIVENTVNGGGCLNCHSYSGYSPDTMMFHARGTAGGTVLKRGDSLKKVDLTGKGPRRQGVYPMWHPGGRYIAFSSNDTHQTFFGPNGSPIEVYDIESDLMLYDTETDSVLTDSRFFNTGRWETFPAWSPDGKWLYFCSADSCGMPLDRHRLKYDIMRVAFDAQSAAFGAQVDTVWPSARNGGSASFPRMSPDGGFLMFTRTGSGTFPIWHEDADLCLIRMSDGAVMDTDLLNSRESDSYHSWSSTGRWVVFGSRRLDGRYTRLFFAHVAPDGTVSKPFLLPQPDPRYNLLRLKSYNIPEFTTGKVSLPVSEIEKLF